MSSFFSSFIDLPNATCANEFKAVPLNPNRKDFLAKTDDGAPVFLLHDASTAKYNPSINFRYLSAQFHVTCRVKTGTIDIEDQFCLVSCDAAETELHELFVRCVGSAIEELPENIGTKELEFCISQMRDLFRALSSPNSREVSGLWAELFVISKSSNSEKALSLWHDDQFDRFDFSSNTLRIEVKSTVRGLRAHEFALEQLQTPDGGVGFVTSVLLQPLSGGVGVLDIARSIEANIMGNSRLKLKLWSNVIKALGGDFSERLDKRYDQVFAEKNLEVYLMNNIPRPDIPADSRISAIRFVSNLVDVPSLALGTKRELLKHIFS